jgi:hypothetical protein
MPVFSGGVMRVACCCQRVIVSKSVNEFLSITITAADGILPRMTDEFIEKLIHMQQVEGVAFPMSTTDSELLQRFAGVTSFNIDDDYDEVSNRVAEHGYTLEVMLSPDENFGARA